ncbi:MAG: zinc ribbon domain-containing protein [Firmicutes bacterium]|nr:zinc ribbon domain-containing protein [Bacillota bacterium]
MRYKFFIRGDVMPIYAYHCLECSAYFEILCKTEEKQNSPLCPQCNSESTKGIFAGFGVLRGDGASVNIGCSGCKGGNCSSCC